jgi:hypothetical protein
MTRPKKTTTPKLEPGTVVRAPLVRSSAAQDLAHRKPTSGIVPASVGRMAKAGAPASGRAKLSVVPDPSDERLPPPPTLTEDDRALMDPSAFESARVDIALFNTTTRTEVKKGAPIQLIEVQSGTIVIETPTRACAKGHNVTLTIRVIRPRIEGSFEVTVTAKVEEMEALGDGVDRITAKLVQYDNQEWEKFLGIFDSRQAEIERFFLAAKGY